MMHKVKDAFSKFLNPSFLFSTNCDTVSPKRKRSMSIDDNTDEEQIDTTISSITSPQTTASKYVEQTTRYDDLQLIDEEDDYNLEQQNKRRRIVNSQPILTTDGHQNDERMYLYSNRTRSSFNHRVYQTKSHEQNYNRISSIHREPTSNYDPSKSILFTANTRKPINTITTTTNPQLHEFSANYLLATSLVDKSYSFAKKGSQTAATTLTNPMTNNNRLLSNERQMLKVSNALITSNNLPYIERLRRRTLRECIRLNRTLDNEPLTTSTSDQHQLTTNSSELKQTKIQSKECGIQCDISFVENPGESNNNTQHTFPPKDIQYEALSTPTSIKIQSSTQTELQMEKSTLSMPKIDITKPKLLGDITPFSWPTFARTQEEYAKKYPDKCHNSMKSSTNEKANLIENSTLYEESNTNSKLMCATCNTSSSTTQSLSKHPSSSIEHPVQTSSSSLRYSINPNYEKSSMIASIITFEKEPISSKQLPDVTVKESNISEPITTFDSSITTNDNSQSASIANTRTTTSAPLFPFSAILTVKAKENSVVPTSSTSFAPAPFTSLVTTKENSFTNSTSLATPSLATVSTDANCLRFGTAFMTPPTPVIEETFASNSTLPLFAIARTTKENSSTVGPPLVFSTTAFGKTVNSGVNDLFKFGTSLEPVSSLPTTNLTTVTTTSSTPSIFTVNSSPSMPQGSSFISAPSEQLVSNSNATITTIASTLQQPIVFTSLTNTSTQALLANSAISSASTEMASLPSLDSCPMSRSSSPILIDSTTVPPTTTTTPFQFVTEGFKFQSPATTTTNNSTFGIAPMAPDSFTLSGISSMNANSTSINDSGALIGTNPIAFGTSSNTSSNVPLGILFGSSSNTATNPIQTLGSSTISTAGLPSSTQAPSFGIGPSAFSLSGSSSGFGFGVISSASATAGLPSSAHAPSFGIGPSAFSFSGSSSGFSFGMTSSTSATAGLPSSTQASSFGIGSYAFSPSGSSSSFRFGVISSIPTLNDPSSSVYSSSSIANPSQSLDIADHVSNIEHRPKLIAKRRCPN